MSFDLMLTRAALLTLAVAACWGLVLLGCVLVEAATAGRWRPARSIGCPRAWRVALVGAVLVVLGASASQADAPGSALESRVLDGLRLPDRATGSVSDPDGYRVRAGDSLWRIARAQLGARAGPRAVAAYVAALHHLNRAGIGADPDLIRPGLELRLPSPLPRHR